MAKHRMQEGKATKSGFTSIAVKPATLLRFNKLLGIKMASTGERPNQDAVLNELIDLHEARQNETSIPV